MEWKEPLRSFQVAQRRAERESMRRQRELERRRNDAAKMEALERARLEFDLYENHVAWITTMHRDCGPTLDWKALAEADPPDPTEYEALSRHDGYVPNRIDKILRRVEWRQDKLANAIVEAREQDAEKPARAETCTHASIASAETPSRGHARGNHIVKNSLCNTTDRILRLHCGNTMS